MQYLSNTHASESVSLQSEWTAAQVPTYLLFAAVHMSKCFWTKETVDCKFIAIYFNEVQTRQAKQEARRDRKAAQDEECNHSNQLYH